MDPAINSQSKAIELWDLKLVEHTSSDEKPIVCSDTICFYFQWPASLFDKNLLDNLEITPLDIELGATSYAKPGRGLSPEAGRNWIIYFVRITTTLLKSPVNDQTWFKVWLRQVITQLPSSWFNNRTWRHVLADQLEKIILPQGLITGGEIDTSGTVDKGDDISPEMKTLLEEIRTFTRWI